MAIELPLEQHINVDLTESYNGVVYCNQYDEKSRIVCCHIMNNGIAYEISPDTKVTLLIDKPNGKKITRVIGDGFGSINKNIVSFPIDLSMSYAHGRAECSLQFMIDDRTLYSDIFYIRIRQIAVDYDEVEDTDEYKSIEESYQKYMEETKKIMDSKTNEIASSNEPEEQLVGDFWLKLL